MNRFTILEQMERLYELLDKRQEIEFDPSKDPEEIEALTGEIDMAANGVEDHVDLPVPRNWSEVDDPEEYKREIATSLGSGRPFGGLMEMREDPDDPSTWFAGKIPQGRNDRFLVRMFRLKGRNTEGEPQWVHQDHEEGATDFQTAERIAGEMNKQLTQSPAIAQVLQIKRHAALPEAPVQTKEFLAKFKSILEPQQHQLAKNPRNISYNHPTAPVSLKDPSPMKEGKKMDDMNGVKLSKNGVQLLCESAETKTFVIDGKLAKKIGEYSAQFGDVFERVSNDVYDGLEVSLSDMRELIYNLQRMEGDKGASRLANTLTKVRKGENVAAEQPVAQAQAVAQPQAQAPAQPAAPATPARPATERTPATAGNRVAKPAAVARPTAPAAPAKPAAPVKNVAPTRPAAPVKNVAPTRPAAPVAAKSVPSVTAPAPLSEGVIWKLFDLTCQKLQEGIDNGDLDVGDEVNIEGGFNYPLAKNIHDPEGLLDKGGPGAAEDPGMGHAKGFDDWKRMFRESGFPLSFIRMMEARTGKVLAEEEVVDLFLEMFTSPNFTTLFENPQYREWPETRRNNSKSEVASRK